MFKIRQLLRLYADGKGSKFISRITGISRNTIKVYLLQFVAPGFTIARIEVISDRQLATAFLIVKLKVESSRVSNLETLPKLMNRYIPAGKC